LARNFRFYEKKRGNRRTGSRLVGRAGEALFWAAFLVLGCIWLFYGFLTFVVPEWRVNHEFAEHTCTVLDKRIGESKDQDGGAVYRPEVRVEYKVKDETYTAWTYDIHTIAPGDRMAYSSQRPSSAAAIEGYAANKQYVCWYDPANPRVVVLKRGYSGWYWLEFLVPMSFVVIGGWGLLYAVLHWGKSAESRAAMMRHTQLDLRGTGGPSAPCLPSVPDWSDITSSPGTRLAFRLPITSSPAWVLFGLLLACLLWNGVVSWFVVLAVHQHLAGQPDWSLTLFVVPFLLAGIAMIALFVRQLIVTTRIGPTLVEISAHPLLPGSEYRVFVSQSGRLKMESLDLSLVCEEEATYRQGTNARTETREVYRQQVLRREQFEVRQGASFEAECALCVPAYVMHSFKANHNAVQWKLVVQGDVAGWRGFRRSFSVIVQPAPRSSQA
jgi:hypothetical protein